MGGLRVQGGVGGMKRNEGLPASSPIPPLTTPLLSLYLSLPISICPSLLLFPLPSFPSFQPIPPTPPPQFSLAAAPPTSFPLFSSLSSVCCCHIVHGSGSSYPFAPIPDRRRLYILDRRGDEEVSLDSAEEAERLVVWGCKFSLVDLQ